MHLKVGYKKTEVGIIPADWQVKSFAELAEIERGRFSARPRNDPRYYGGDFPFIQTGDVARSNGKISTFSQTLNDSGLNVSKLFPKGTLFFTIAANIGDVGIVDFPAACPDSLVAITPRRDVVKTWLLFELSKRKGSFENLASPGAQLNINLEKLRPYLLPLPPHLEQQAIAEALSDVDALIEALEILVAKKRAIKQGALQDLLSGRKRLPGFSGEWKQSTFGDLFHFFTTATNSREDLSEDGDTFYVHYGDIHTRFHSNLDFAKQAVPKILKARCSNAVALKNGDWIMADASEDYDGIGKSVEVSGLDERIVAVSGLHTFLLREKAKTFAPGFKGHLGNSSGLRCQYLRVMTGMKVYGVSKAALKGLVLPIPEWREQEAIRDILDNMDSELGVLEARLGKARQIKQGMMQELLTGRVRLV